MCLLPWIYTFFINFYIPTTKNHLVNCTPFQIEKNTKDFLDRNPNKKRCSLNRKNSLFLTNWFKLFGVIPISIPPLGCRLQNAVLQRRVSGLEPRACQGYRKHRKLVSYPMIRNYLLTDGPPTSYTPLKTNMSPENQWLEDVFPTETVPF